MVSWKTYLLGSCLEEVWNALAGEHPAGIPECTSVQARPVSGHPQAFLGRERAQGSAQQENIYYPGGSCVCVCVFVCVCVSRQCVSVCRRAFVFVCKYRVCSSGVWPVGWITLRKALQGTSFLLKYVYTLPSALPFSSNPIPPTYTHCLA